jgi:hypothetical protein
MAASAEFVDQAASLIRRTRAGDQNAQATIYRIGEEARSGSKNRRILAMAAAIKQYVDSNPADDYQLGAEPAIIASTPEPSKALAKVPKAKPAVVVQSPEAKAQALEMRKPPLPLGIFDQFFDPECFALVVVRACQYRHGLNAAAVILAAGPPLTGHAIRELGYSQFGSDESSSVYFHGVKYHTQGAWNEVAPHLDASLRRCLAIGQCVGRARRIQAVRAPRSQISAYSLAAGWELGE